MRLQPDALSPLLKKSFFPIYLLYGNEAFLIEESAKTIRQAFEASLSGEYTALTLENAASWEQLESVVFNRSLFSEKRLIDLRLSSKISAKEAALLVSLFEAAGEDLYFILQCGSLPREQQKSSWFSIADQKGLVIAHWPLMQSSFTTWLKNRLIAKGLPPSPTLLSELTYYTVGNCLAAAQEIEQLALLSDGTPSTEGTVAEVKSQFSVFDLIEAALQQKSERLLHILHALKANETALPLVLWALSQTLRHLSVCEAEPDDSKRINFLKRAGIKPFLQRIYIKRASQQPSPSTLYPQLQALDQGVKTGQIRVGWPEITAMTLKLAGITN